jgi:Arc/MetJ-type ribon-helix-helix transcriptional regulator
MGKSIRVKPKKRGRPATGKDPLIGARMPLELIREIDTWAKHNTGGSRSEAIRRLVEQALAAEPLSPRSRTKGAPKAAEMAGREIDQLGDQSVTGEERASRKRRLIKGPREFRDIRTDRPKPKT